MRCLKFSLALSSWKGQKRTWKRRLGRRAAVPGGGPGQLPAVVYGRK